MFFILFFYLACLAFEEQEQMCQNSTLVPTGRLRLDLVSQFVHNYLKRINIISVSLNAEYLVKKCVIVL